MSQANVYTSVSAQSWYTDKCRIATGNTAVTYNVDIQVQGNGSLGRWNASTNSPTLGNNLPAGTPAASTYLVSVAGTQDIGFGSTAFAVGDVVIYNGSTWSYVSNPQQVGNIFSNATSIPAYTSSDVWVGVGNKLTITGANFTAQEVGTTTSGSSAVVGIF